MTTVLVKLKNFRFDAKATHNPFGWLGPLNAHPTFIYGGVVPQHFEPGATKFLSGLLIIPLHMESL